VNHEGVKVVTVDIPKQYKASYRNMYKADAESVDLQALGPNFYNLALKMPAIDRFQGRDIIESALQVCFKTYIIYLDHKVILGEDNPMI